MADNLPSLADLLQGRDYMAPHGGAGAGAFAQPGLAPFSVAPQFARAGQGMNSLFNSVQPTPPRPAPYGPYLQDVTRGAELQGIMQMIGQQPYSPGPRVSENVEDRRDGGSSYVPHEAGTNLQTWQPAPPPQFPPIAWAPPVYTPPSWAQNN